CPFFFFSSRRRHTRSKRDWSSDVCSSDLVIQLQFLQLFCQCIIYRFFFLIHIFINGFLIHTAFIFFFLPRFKARHFFTVPADTSENLPVTRAAQRHFLLTFRTSGGRYFFNVTFISAFSVLAYVHRAFFAFDFQQRFAAFRTVSARQIIVLEFLLARLDFFDNLFRVFFHIFDK